LPRERKPKAGVPQPASPDAAGRPPVGFGAAPWAWAGLAIALAAGAWLRLRGLGEPGLWTDELVSWWAASAPSLGEVLSRASGCMATPPLSFVAEHVSIGMFGGSEWAMRLPSALAGLAAIVLVFVAGWRMFGPAAGAFSALFLAIHPYHLWFSTDARPYALSILLAAGSTWALSEMLRSWRPGAIAAYALCAAGLLYTQFVFLPLLAAHALALLLAWWADRDRPFPWGRAAAAFGGAALLSLPLVPHLLGVAGRAGSLTWPVQGEFPPGVSWMFQTTPLVTAVLVYLAVVWLRSHRAVGEAAPAGEGDGVARRSDLLALALAALLPLIALGLLSYLLDLPSLVKPRYGAAYLAPCALLVGWAVTRPTWPTGRRVLAGTYLALIVLAGVLPVVREGRSFNINAANEDWRGALTLVQSELQPGDLVLARTGLVEGAILYDGSYPDACTGYVAAPIADLYLSGRPEIVVLPPELAATPYPASYDVRIARRLGGRSRVWLVMFHGRDPNAYFRAIGTYVQESSGRPFRLAKSTSFRNVTVALLVAPS